MNQNAPILCLGAGLLSLLLLAGPAYAQEREFEDEAAGEEAAGEAPTTGGEASAATPAPQVIEVESVGASSGEGQAGIVAVPVVHEPSESGTPVQFISPGRRGEVIVIQDQACRTPCVLNLRPGDSEVAVVGAERMFRGRFQVPAESAAFDLVDSDRELLMGIGGAMVAGGVAVAASLWSLFITCGFDGGSGGCVAGHLITWPLLGTATFVAGLVLIGEWVDRPSGELRPSRLAQPRSQAGLRLRTVGIAPTADGGVSGGLTLDF